MISNNIKILTENLTIPALDLLVWLFCIFIPQAEPESNMVLGVQNESRQEADQHEQTESTRQVVVLFASNFSFYSVHTVNSLPSFFLTPPSIKRLINVCFNLLEEDAEDDDFVAVV